MADQPPSPPPPPPPEQDSAMSDADKVSPNRPLKRPADEHIAQIRAKRLAKLGGPTPPGPSRTPSTALDASTPSSSSPKPTEVDASAQQPPQTQATPPPNPFSQLGIKTDDAPKAQITIKPKPVQRSSSGTLSRPAPKAQEVSIEAWEDRNISGVFRITLDENRTHDTHGHKLFFAADAKGDLEDEARPLRFTTDMLDSVILESASSQSQGSALHYLLGCWKRVSKLFKSISNKSDPKFEIAKEARRLCFSYCIFAATMPDMFGEETPAENPLAERLLLGPDDEHGICYDFLTEASQRIGEDETIREALVGAMEDLSRRLATVSMNGDYKPYMLILRVFIRFPPLIAALGQSETFLPADIEAQHIETRTFLGPFFRLSPMQSEVALNYFSGSAATDKSLIANAQRAVRMTLQTHQEELLDITNAFIKNKETREKILDWFALTVNKNHKRRAIQVDSKTVSSDGFMVNVTVILDRLCEPFMDATFSKIDRIEIDYLRRSPRVDIKDETKINADQQTSDEFYSHKVEGTNNFISEVFFLTVAAHHYGTEAANSKLSSLQKDVKWLEKELAKMEPERHKYMSNPVQLQVFDNHIRKVKDQIERGKCSILAIQGVLLDETTQARSMQLMRYVIVWLLRLVSPGASFPKKELQLPLPSEQPVEFMCLPEYFVEDIVGNFKFITRVMPHIITTTQCEELVKICIALLRSSEYIKNPYLKSGLVTILFFGVWEIPGRSKGVLGDTLFAHPFAMQHLLHSLMKFYIECESTGAHTQFYDKFNIRYEIFQVIKCIWPNTVYRDNLATEARVNLEFFVQFVNLLLNDVTFVLDESFTAFKDIHEISKVLKNPPADMDQNERQEQEEKLSAAQGKAKSYMQLTNETVAMLKLFTEALADSFTKKEVVVRLAHMLDYNLEALVGPKKSNLKVENPEDYGWNPRNMLAEVTDVYLNLQSKQSFIDSVATDGRSYRAEYWDEAYKILQRFKLKSPEQMQEWQDMAERIKTAKDLADLEEADLGDIPEEYTDPILATLMEDPVTLPISKIVVDRSTIQSHLLSDPHDPFNRTPLTIDDVIPNTQLQEEIQSWKANLLAQKMAERKAAAAGDAMDTS
ncbi:ubiquitin fusion degradation protein-like protein UfdB [Cucurbitaria berberidis CBS 394.84]|uniref:Ubiquitin fusion degradation protein-like protein UfdB n=1 Tax=Cucurbitaria berberidis CBS 394.84 TaxID=1168544 RepID=A0A9P4LCP9_9PLEO|nr:ubiquitin fusion degradation protein-like protein UfdB [Cucurbitaria berberidis CBS 394.84]KAF1849592.1 ubiquitin fusion degradation protein-like protein UfdB [Cucurbitaria berberidis CBS 394.84]